MACACLKLVAWNQLSRKRGNEIRDGMREQAVARETEVAEEIINELASLLVSAS
jgi:hypothetical protein